MMSIDMILLFSLPDLLSSLKPRERERRRGREKSRGGIRNEEGDDEGSTTWERNETGVENHH